MTTPLIPPPTIHELEPLLPDTAPPTPYPIESLPKLMQAAVRAIADHAQAPLALAGQCVVSHAAHMAQTRVNAPDIHNPDGMPCSLYMLTLGCSGDRKSSCRKMAFKVIDKAEREARTRHHQLCKEVAAEADMYRGKEREKFLAANPIPRDPRTQFTDATYEPIVGSFIRGNSAASWDTDEGGQVLGGYSLNERSETRAATIGGLSRIYDDGSCERTRANGNLEGSGFAYHRRLNMHLMAQPLTVEKALADPLLIAQGFLPRFLFASPDSIAGTRFLTEEMLKRKSHDDPRLQAFWARDKELMASQEYIDPETGEVKPPVLALTDEAELVWLDFYNEVERGQGPLGKFSGLRPFAGRSAENARRVAAVFTFFEGSGHIDGNCMHRACEIVRYSLEEWLRYTDRVLVNPELTQAIELLKWLLVPKRVSEWQVFHRDRLSKSGPTLLRNAKKRDAALALLLEKNLLLSADGKTFRINPLMDADSADSAERPKVDNIAVAEDLRKVAENTRRESTALENPHLSAKNPQNGTHANPSFPRNPQYSQPPQYSDEM